jgi:hypothetical protein
MMRMRSKLIALALAACLPLPAQALNIFACEPEWAGLAQALAPEAQVTSATHAYQDPHYIEARPSLIARLRRADLAVCSGAALEAGWLPALQQRAANPAVQPGQPGMLFMADVVTTIDQLEQVPFGAGDVHPEGNPHLQLDPERMRQAGAALSQRLAQIDPEQAGAYRAGYLRWSLGWPVWMTGRPGSSRCAVRKLSSSTPRSTISGAGWVLKWWPTWSPSRACRRHRGIWPHWSSRLSPNDRWRLCTAGIRTRRVHSG